MKYTHDQINGMYDPQNQNKILMAYYLKPELIKKYWLEEDDMVGPVKKYTLQALHICSNRGYKNIDLVFFHNILRDNVRANEANINKSLGILTKSLVEGHPEEIEAYYEIERKYKALRGLARKGIDISYFYAVHSDFPEDENYKEHFENTTAEGILNYYKDAIKDITLPANKNSISLIPKRASELERAHEPIEYLIDGWIKKDSFNSIIGAAKAGKTQLTMAIAFCIQNGIPFFGYECKKADVLYVDFELEHNEILKRINLLKQYYEMPEAEEFYYISASREFANGNINMDGILEAVREAKKNNPNIKLCIFDCYYTFAEGDSNAENDTRRNLQPLKGLVNDMAVCYVHHTNKASGDITNLIYAAGGSGVHGKIVDSTIVVWPKSSNSNLFYVATTGRSGGGKKITCRKDETTFHQFMPVNDVNERCTLGGRMVGNTKDKNPKEEHPEIWEAIGPDVGDLRKIKPMFNVTTQELKEMGFRVDSNKHKIWRK